MASKSESSHATNIANFKTLIIVCEKFGTIYFPSNDSISIVNMEAQVEEVEDLFNDHIVAYEATKNPIYLKSDLIKKIKKRAIKTKDFFVATNASASTKKDVKGLVRAITGSNVRKKKPKDGMPAQKWVSNSHLGVAKIMDNFEKLVSLYQAEEHYTPNENDFKIASLLALVDDLSTANTLVAEVTADEAIKRVARNEGLYREDTGLVDVSLKCKNYVKAVFGARSAEAKLVTKIKLKRIMRKKEV